MGIFCHMTPLHIELWLIVEVTSAFPKEGLTRVLRDNVSDFVYNMRGLI